MAEDKETRKIIAAAQIERNLLRQHGSISDGALDFLRAAAEKTAAFDGYVSGREELLDMATILDAVAQSEAHKIIFRDREESAEPRETDHVEKTAGMSAQARINYARKHGLL